MASCSRRTALKLGTAGLFGAALASTLQSDGKTLAADCDSVATERSRAPKLSGLIQNEDCTNFFYFQDFPPGEAGAIVDAYVDVLAEAGVTVLMCNTNARRTNYHSKVWEAFWDGYDPKGPDDQKFLAAVPPKSRPLYRKLIGNMLEVHRQGVDYPQRVIARCRARNIAPWISLRMNDVHENNNLDHPFHSNLWRQSQFFRQGHPGYYARALDYTHPEVRAHYQALVAETLERYDVDGLELDFLREPYLFSAGREKAGQAILIEWLRGVRRLADEAAKRRGHPVRLGVRVPSCPETAIGLGLDAPTWAREGLVDLVVAAPRWSTLEYAMPLDKWRNLLGDEVTLAGGLEVNYRPTPQAAARAVTPEEAHGAAMAVLSGGADVVYLFNYFQHGHPQWQPPLYQRALRAMSSLERLRELPRRHAVTFRDVVLPGEKYRAPLPASGKELSFVVPLGPSPTSAWQMETLIEIAASAADRVAPAVSLNGVTGKPASEVRLKTGNRQVSYRFAASAVSGRNDDIVRVTSAADKPVEVHRVEVCLRPTAHP